MSLKFYKQKTNSFSLINIHFGYLLPAMVFLFFSVALLTYEFNAYNRDDKYEILLLMLLPGIFFLAFSFNFIEINCDKRTIVNKRIFTLWRQVSKYENLPVNFLTIRQYFYGFYVGVDVAIEIGYKRIVLTRFLNTRKIEPFINETKTILNGLEFTYEN